MMKANKIFLIAIVSASFSGCGEKHVNAVVDTLYIKDEATYKKDLEHCQQVALTYDLSDEKLANGALYGTLGAGTAAAAALTIGAGVINPVAIPFIVGATALGAAGGAMSTEERQARENIMYQCLATRGYTTYNPQSTNLIPTSSAPSKQVSSVTEANVAAISRKCTALGFIPNSKEHQNCVDMLSK